MTSELDPKPKAGPGRRTGAGDTDGKPQATRDRARRTERLLRRYHQDGDQRAREALIGQFLPLARQLARRYQGTNEPFDDLVQVANVGLVKAIDRFDPERGVAFSSYAVPTILGELKRYFRDSGWAVHVPRGIQERVISLDHAGKALASSLGRPPTVAELAEETGTDLEHVLEAMEASHAYDAISLDAQRGGRGPGADNDGETYAETLGVDDERFDLIEHTATISPALQTLSERDRMVLYLRFVEDLTQSDIAKRVGVSQMQVSRLIRRSLVRLREAAAPEPAPE